MDMTALLRRLTSLSAFHELYEKPIFQASLDLVKALDRWEPSAALTAWGSLLSQLDQYGFDSLGAWLRDQLLFSDAPLAPLRS